MYVLVWLLGYFAGYLSRFTIAQRMQIITKNLANTNQSAYIKARYMCTNIRLVSDVLEYYDLASKGRNRFMLDFTKTFDTIQWDFMFESLKYFNFGLSFLRLIETVYHKPEACIKNNGYISD